MSIKVSTRPSARSTVVLEVELPPDRVQRSVDESLRHLARRTRVPGFRPGKAPRPVLERALGVRRDDPAAPNPLYEDAKEHLFEASVLEAVRQEDLDVLSISKPEWLRFAEGEGASYRVTLPLRPAVTLGAYTEYPFKPQIDEIDDAKVDAVIEQLRDQQASLVPVEDRGAREGDFVVVGVQARLDDRIVEGLTVERLPLLIGQERMIPGFETQLVGMREEEEKTFALAFPADYQNAELAGRETEFTVVIRELREKRLPEADDEFARSIGSYADLRELRDAVRQRLERNALDRARHGFADRIIEFAVANASVEVPDLLVDREVEVMLDELRVRLAEQGIGFEQYLAVTERDETKLHEEYREPAEHRVKVLLVLGEIAEREGVQAPDEHVDAEVARARERYTDNPRLVAHFESPRGREYIRSTLRRSQTVEMLVDRWIADHAEFAGLRHLDDHHTHAATNETPTSAAPDAEPSEPQPSTRRRP